VYCGVVSEPGQVGSIMSIAIQSSIGRRGVSVVVVPGDVAWAEAEATGPLDFSDANPVVTPPAEDVRRAAELLNAAGRVTIFAGAGCSGAHQELVSVAAKLKAPIVHTLRGKEYVEYDNPFDVGLTGLLGFSSGYYAMMDSDVLLILGADEVLSPHLTLVKTQLGVIGLLWCGYRWIYFVRCTY
jgi:pyruvate dehydrogenase (quinone)